MSDFVKQLRKHLADAFPDVKVYDWDEEVRSSPIPLETMIEDMATSGHPVLIMKNRHGGYSAQRNAYTTERTIEGHTETYLDGEKTLVERGDAPREAIERLHAAWRERG